MTLLRWEKLWLLIRAVGNDQKKKVLCCALRGLLSPNPCTSTWCPPGPNCKTRSSTGNLPVSSCRCLLGGKDMEGRRAPGPNGSSALALWRLSSANLLPREDTRQGLCSVVLPQGSVPTYSLHSNLGYMASDSVHVGGQSKQRLDPSRSERGRLKENAGSRETRTSVIAVHHA